MLIISINPSPKNLMLIAQYSHLRSTQVTGSPLMKLR